MGRSGPMITVVVAKCINPSDGHGHAPHTHHPEREHGLDLLGRDAAAVLALHRVEDVVRACIGCVCCGWKCTWVESGGGWTGAELLSVMSGHTYVPQQRRTTTMVAVFSDCVRGSVCVDVVRGMWDVEDDESDSRVGRSSSTH